MKEVKLTQGRVAIVDDGDYEMVSQYKWCAWFSGWNWYAVGTINKKHTYMHRLIIQAPKGSVVDHRNHDGLDNRRENIRLCTTQENAMNGRTPRDNKSGYKGVVKVNGSYATKIRVNGAQLHGGNYDTAIDAAIAYNHLAKEHYGEFANYNEIEGWENIFPRRRDSSLPNKHGYKGIQYASHVKRWRAQIYANGKRYHLGYYETKENAARRYDEAALELLGDKAKLNFPKA